MKRESPVILYLKHKAVDKILHGKSYPKSLDEVLSGKFKIFRKSIPAYITRTERAVKSRLAALEKSEKVDNISVLCGIPKTKIIERVLRGNMKLNREDMLIYLMSALDKFDADGIDNPMLRSEVFKLLKK